MYYSEEYTRAAHDARIKNLAKKANALASATSSSRQRASGRGFEDNDSTYGYDSELWRQLSNVICDFAQQSRNCPNTIEGWTKFINRLIDQLSQSQSQSQQRQFTPRQTRPQKKTKDLPIDFFSSDSDMENDVSPQRAQPTQTVAVRQPLGAMSNSTLNSMQSTAEYSSQSYRSRNTTRSPPRPQRTQNYDESSYYAKTESRNYQPGNFYAGVHHSGSGVVFQGSADPHDNRSHVFGESSVSGSGFLFQGSLPPDLAVRAAQSHTQRQSQLQPQPQPQISGQRLGAGSEEQAVVQSRTVASDVRTMTPAEAARLRWQNM